MALTQPAPASPWNFAPEPIEGNSLTRATRSLQNQFGLRSEDLYNRGLQAFGGGWGVTGEGRDAQAAGLKTLDAPLNYWMSLLSGNRPEMTQALAPEIGRINAGYSQAKRTVGQFAPSGGGRSAFMGELPFKQAQDVSNLFSQVRPAAAGAVTDIGAKQAGIGQGIANTGMGMLQAALAQLGLSTSTGQAGLSGMLGMRGQDITESGQWKQLLASLAGSASQMASAGMASSASMTPRP